MDDSTSAQALADALNAYDGEHEWRDVVIVERLIPENQPDA